MMNKVLCAQIDSLQVRPVSIEIDISPGLFNFKIVGLTSKSVDEAKERINSAIKKIGYKAPKHSNRKTVISLTPADMPKKGAHFDAAIAINYLIETRQIQAPKRKTLVVGELSFNGDIRATDACRIIAIQAKQLGVDKILLPHDAYSKLLDLLPIQKVFCNNLTEVIEEISKEAKNVSSPTAPEVEVKNSKKHKMHGKYSLKNQNTEHEQDNTFLIDSVQGNKEAKRALLIALAGGHHLSLCGIPGAGKTLLAKSASQLLPELSLDDAIVSSSLHLMKGIRKDSLEAPFRNPHHNSSTQSIIGGGSIFKPGEISLAHKGIFFLDEFLEFKKEVIEGLRNILESKTITIHRSNYSAESPCDCITIIAYNPCPCGYAESSIKRCTCTARSIELYKKKLSGPILDRIDLRVYIEKIDYKKLSTLVCKNNKGGRVNSNRQSCNNESGYTTGVRMKEVIQKARARQQSRQNKLNSDLTHTEIMQLVSQLDETARLYLNKASEKLSLSARGYHSIIKVAQTICDIDGKKPSRRITKKAVQEALYFRVQHNN